MALQVLVKEFVGYSALFLRTIEGKPTCPHTTNSIHMKVPWYKKASMQSNYRREDTRTVVQLYQLVEST
jgi:hypothetical protein